MRRDLRQPVRDVLDERQRGLLELGLVAGLVRVEPLALVVLLELPQELEQIRGEGRGLGGAHLQKAKARASVRAGCERCCFRARGLRRIDPTGPARPTLPLRMERKPMTCRKLITGAAVLGLCLVVSGVSVAASGKAPRRTTIKVSQKLKIKPNRYIQDGLRWTKDVYKVRSVGTLHVNN